MYHFHFIFKSNLKVPFIQCHRTTLKVPFMQQFCSNFKCITYTVVNVNSLDWSIKGLARLVKGFLFTVTSYAIL